jgi:hypothetical protein
VTSQGHGATIFQRTIERGDLLTAESVVRELGGVRFRDALELAAMIALHDARRSRCAGARWLQRWLDETAM